MDPLSLPMAVVLTDFLQAVFENLYPLVRDELRLKSEIREELERLTQTFSVIKDVLKEAEERQHGDSGVRQWLNNLRSVTYDMNDVLDEFATEAQRRRLVRLAKVRDYITVINPKRIMYGHDIFHRLKKITRDLNNLAQQQRDFGFKVLGHPARSHEALLQTTSLNPPSAVGRKDDTQTIVRLLVSPDGHSEARIPVIPIVGMGGLGKTTLAQLVYNDEKVKSHFELRLWVHVSPDFNIKRITKAIIESSGRSNYDPMTLGSLTLDSLQRDLQETLSGRTYLLVLDDFWNENPQDWDRLRVPLLYGAKGSKILVTTRNHGVADMIGTSSPYRLEGLSDDDCWTLFCQCALDRNPDPHHELSNVRREIMRKCNHLPLAAIALGYRLRRESDRSKWRNNLQHEAWEFSGEDSDITRAVSSSYHHLARDLKPCFAYCAIIPKGYEFEKEAVVHWWMAQNFIRPRNGERIEDAGSRYFDSLVERSFIRYSHLSYTNHQPWYTMHDLIHDFARHVAGEECRIVETAGRPRDISNQTRHLTLIYGQFSPNVSTPSRSSTQRRSEFEPIFGAEGLYTLIVVVGGSMRGGMQIPDNLTSRLSRLRTLDLSNSGVTSLPKSIGDLKHLRCLRLCDTDIKQLPDTVEKLYNLQTLSLRNCYMLEELPEGTRNLLKLRHLDMSLDADSTSMTQTASPGQPEWGSLRSMPPKIGALTELQTLSRFVLSTRRGCGRLKELQDLNDLHGKLLISNLHLVSHTVEAAGANLSNKEFLECLELRWGAEGGLYRNLHVEKDVLEGLKPHPNIKELQIVRFNGQSFPSWIENSSFSNLVTLRLLDCKRCETLPPLGQLPALKDLFIKGMDGLQTISCEFCGNCHSFIPFPSLVKLHLEGMPRLQAWYGGETCGIFCLRELTIKGCSDLRQLTHKLPSLTKLEIEESPRLLGLPQIPSLRTLIVKECGQWIWESQSGLSSLSSLILAKLPSETFPPIQQGRLASLQRLEIIHCDHLISLPDDWLPARLTYFGIKHCPQLLALPTGMGKLKSLEDLEISDCQSLQCLPSDGLPNNLQFLSINNCPKLAQRCHRERGEDWPKIARIVSVWIDKEIVVTTPSHGKRPQYSG